MFKIAAIIRPYALALALLASFPTHADEVAALLKKADSYRLPEAAARIETLVELYRNDALNKERSYTVYIKPGRRSLVLMKSPSELGQKVLMLADQFWLLMPDTQRPLRITATQKLLGEAATGDISSMSWSEDYTGQVVGEAPCPSRDASPQPRRCLHLDLNAARPGVTYARIELYLDKSDKLPIKADLYVNSGKRAKEAWFDAQPLDGRLRIVSMTLLDDIQSGRRTLVRYRKIEAKEAPDEFFNPAALVRNSLAGW
ncbi:MAG: outer membrane lipoprotein-sorting protein [Sulfuricellaceae bacterium]